MHFSQYRLYWPFWSFYEFFGSSILFGRTSIWKLKNGIGEFIYFLAKMMIKIKENLFIHLFGIAVLPHFKIYCFWDFCPLHQPHRFKKGHSLLNLGFHIVENSPANSCKLFFIDRIFVISQKYQEIYSISWTLEVLSRIFDALTSKWIIFKTIMNLCMAYICIWLYIIYVRVY